MTSPRHRSVRFVALAVAVFFAASCFAARAAADGSGTTSRHSRKTVKHTAATGPHAKAHRASASKSRAHSSALRKKSSTAKSRAHSMVSAKKSSTRSVGGKNRRIPSGSRARLARLHLQSNRVEEIQQALIGAGYLSGPATGAWDNATRDAMRRYQSDNGFSATGLPDAKSLMKLGLGPHPLPSELQPTAAAQVTTPPSETKTSPN